MKKLSNKKATLSLDAFKAKSSKVETSTLLSSIVGGVFSSCHPASDAV